MAEIPLKYQEMPADLVNQINKPKEQPLVYQEVPPAVAQAAANTKSPESIEAQDSARRRELYGEGAKAGVDNLTSILGASGYPQISGGAYLASKLTGKTPPQASKQELDSDTSLNLADPNKAPLFPSEKYPYNIARGAVIGGATGAFGGVGGAVSGAIGGAAGDAAGTAVENNLPESKLRMAAQLALSGLAGAGANVGARAMYKGTMSQSGPAARKFATGEETSFDMLRRNNVEPKFSSQVSDKPSRAQVDAAYSGSNPTIDRSQADAAYTKDAIQTRAEEIARGLDPNLPATKQQFGQRLKDFTDNTYIPGYKKTVGQEKAALQQIVPLDTPVDIRNVVTALSPNQAYLELEPVANQIGGDASKLANAFGVASARLGKDPSLGAIENLRSMVGEVMNTDSLMVGTIPSRMRTLYAGLSEARKDVYKAADAHTPGTFDRAMQLDSFVSQHRGFQDGFLQKLMDLAPEGVYKKIAATSKDGDTLITDLVKNMGPEQQKQMAGFMLNNLGYNAKNEFGLTTFMNNWKKLSPEVKDTLFKNNAAGVDKSIDELVNIVDKSARFEGYLNNSRTGGTAQILAHINKVATGAAVAGGMLLGGLGGAAHTSGDMLVGSAAGSLMAGPVLGGAAYMAEYQIQKAHQNLLGNPAFLKWLATPIGPNALPHHFAALGGVASQAPDLAPDIEIFLKEMATPSKPQIQMPPGTQGYNVQLPKPKGFASGGEATHWDRLHYSGGGLAKEVKGLQLSIAQPTVTKTLTKREVSKGEAEPNER